MPDYGGIRVTGLKDILRDLRKLDPALYKELRVRLKKAVKVIADDAKKKAPHRTGGLAKGIVPSVTQKGAKLVSKAPHGRVIEFGARHPVFGNRNNWVFQPAGAHVFPAVKAGQGDIAREAVAALEDSIREAGLR